MNTMLALVIAISVAGCANIGQATAISVEARASLHAAALAHARETLREAKDWRVLAIEAESATGKTLSQ